MEEIECIKRKDEEEETAELWTTESLCYRYFNFFQQFMIEMATEIQWLQFCSKGNELDDQKISEFEKMKGIEEQI